jgi:hypothetical protein
MSKYAPARLTFEGKAVGKTVARDPLGGIDWPGRCPARFLLE